MKEIFFIADTHWGHKNIIGYNRPQFKDVYEMNDTLVENWNKVVKPKDIIWHLGDVAFGKDNLFYLAQCNGEKRLVLGNHDTYPMTEYLQYFDKVFGAIGYKEAILTHIPVHKQQFFRFKYNIHGHVHHHDPILEMEERYYNVCADHINLTPINWEDIKQELKN